MISVRVPQAGFHNASSPRKAVWSMCWGAFYCLCKSTVLTVKHFCCTSFPPQSAKPRCLTAAVYQIHSSVHTCPHRPVYRHRNVTEFKARQREADSENRHILSIHPSIHLSVHVMHFEVFLQGPHAPSGHLSVHVCLFG